MAADGAEVDKPKWFRRLVRVVASWSREERRPEHATPRWALHCAYHTLVDHPILIGSIGLPIGGGIAVVLGTPTSKNGQALSTWGKAWPYLMYYLYGIAAVTVAVFLFCLVVAPYRQKAALLSRSRALTVKGGSQQSAHQEFLTAVANPNWQKPVTEASFDPDGSVRYVMAETTTTEPEPPDAPTDPGERPDPPD